MVKMYFCESCDYKTSRRSNYDKHLLTKKHQKNSSKPHLSTKTPHIATDEYVCEYCDQSFSRHDSLKRHLRTCILKKNETLQQEVIDLRRQLTHREDTIDELESEIIDLKRTIKRQGREIAAKTYELNEIKDEFIEYAKTSSNTITITGNTFNISSVDTYNRLFSNAPNLSDQIRNTSLTDEQIYEYYNKGIHAGSVEYLRDVFINDRLPAEKSMWVSAPTRFNGYIRIEDLWEKDDGFTEAQKMLVPNLQSLFARGLEIECKLKKCTSQERFDRQSRVQNYLVKENGCKKILKEVLRSEMLTSDMVMT